MITNTIVRTHDPGKRSDSDKTEGLLISLSLRLTGTHSSWSAPADRPGARPWCHTQVLASRLTLNWGGHCRQHQVLKLARDVPFCSSLGKVQRSGSVEKLEP